MKKLFSRAIDVKKLEFEENVKKTTRIIFDDLNPSWYEWFIMDEDKDVVEIFLIFEEEKIVYIGSILTYVPKDYNQYRKLNFRIITEFADEKILGLKAKAKSFKSTMYFQEYNMHQGDSLNIECSIDIFTQTQEETSVKKLRRTVWKNHKNMN